MVDKIYYNVGEKVNYFSSFDHTWKAGVISRFTEDGLTTVAIIWEETPNGSFADKIRLNNDNIRKLQKEE